MMSAFSLFSYHDKLRFARHDQTDMIWCPVRGKYLVKTPEEWVRQLCIAWLTVELGVPRGLISTERSTGKAGRFDIAVYNRSGVITLLIECKAPDVRIDENVAFQWSRYNLQLKAPYGMLTNGAASFFFKAGDDIGVSLLSMLPHFDCMT